MWLGFQIALTSIAVWGTQLGIPLIDYAPGITQRGEGGDRRNALHAGPL